MGMSDEQADPRKRISMSSDFCGERQGQQICTAANKAGLQTSASPTAAELSAK